MCRASSVQRADGDRGPLRALWYRVYLANLLFALGQGALVPVLALSARHLGAHASRTASIVAMDGLKMTIMDVPEGWIASRTWEMRARAGRAAPVRRARRR